MAGHGRGLSWTVHVMKAATWQGLTEVMLELMELIWLWTSVKRVGPMAS